MSRADEVRKPSLVPKSPEVPDAALEISDLCNGAVAYLHLRHSEEETRSMMFAIFPRINRLVDELTAAK